MCSQPDFGVLKLILVGITIHKARRKQVSSLLMLGLFHELQFVEKLE